MFGLKCFGRDCHHSQIYNVPEVMSLFQTQEVGLQHLHTASTWNSPALTGTMRKQQSRVPHTQWTPRLPEMAYLDHTWLWNVRGKCRCLEVHTELASTKLKCSKEPPKSTESPERSLLISWLGSDTPNGCWALDDNLSKQSQQWGDTTASCSHFISDTFPLPHS